MSRHGSTKIILWPLGHGSCRRVWPHWPYIDIVYFLKNLLFFHLCSKLKSGQIVYTVMMSKLCFTLLELIGRVTWSKTGLHWSCHFGVIFPNIYVLNFRYKIKALGIQQTITSNNFIHDCEFNSSEEVDTNMSLLTGPEWSTVILMWPLRPVGF